MNLQVRKPPFTHRKRLSEAIARVHLTDWVKPEHVREAFELQTAAHKQGQRESIEFDEIAAAAEGEQEAGGGGEGGQAARPKRLRITHPEYMRMGQMLLRQLAEQDAAGVVESDLVTWYMEQADQDVRTEEELFQQQHLVQLVINRMITRDRVILVHQEIEQEDGTKAAPDHGSKNHGSGEDMSMTSLGAFCTGQGRSRRPERLRHSGGIFDSACVLFLGATPFLFRECPELCWLLWGRHK
eukprot:s3886_g5.t1